MFDNTGTRPAFANPDTRPVPHPRPRTTAMREMGFDDALDAGDFDKAMDLSIEDFRERRGREMTPDELDRLERNIDAAIGRREKKKPPQPDQPADGPPDQQMPDQPDMAQVDTSGQVPGPSPDATPASGRRSDAAKPLTELFDADDATIKAEMVKAIDGEYAGGLSVRVTQGHSVGDNRIEVQGIILGPDGTSVGDFLRTFYRTSDGRLIAYHDHLGIDSEYQGAGFAADFNTNMIAWYRRSGFDEINLHAGDSVGGYAWPAQGFDFADGARDEFLYGARDSALVLAGIPRPQLGDSDNLMTDQEFEDAYPGWTRAQFLEQLPLFEEIAPRIADGSASAYEMSQLGRKPGQGKSDWWIGKALMLGTEYEAVLPLKEGTS
jgi:hypothetical protein